MTKILLMIVRGLGITLGGFFGTLAVVVVVPHGYVLAIALLLAINVTRSITSRAPWRWQSRDGARTSDEARTTSPGMAWLGMAWARLARTDRGLTWRRDTPAFRGVPLVV
jgi:hypothetical protein